MGSAVPHWAATRSDRERAGTLREGNMGLDDLVNKGKDLFEQNKDKVEGA